MSFFDFFLFNEPSIVSVALGSLLIGLFSGFSGVFLVLDKKSLLGDAIAHSLLPGICLAYIFHQSKFPFVLLIGASVSGIISSLLIDAIVKHSKLRRDAAMAICLSFFFALGIMLLTYIQHHYPSNQSGLESYIFGKAAAINNADLQLISITGSCILALLLFFSPSIKLILLSEEHAKSIGMPVGIIRFCMNIAFVLMIAIGIQAVGVVLMASLLFAPAGIARLISGSFRVILVFAALIGAFSGLFGAAISYSMPAMPTGPWIVMVLFSLSFLVLFLKTFSRRNV